jgi:hypothetical protein
MRDYAFIGPNGESYKQSFNNSVTVADAKSLLPRLLGLPFRVQFFHLRNRRLGNSTHLSSLQLQPGPGIFVTFFAFSCPPHAAPLLAPDDTTFLSRFRPNLVVSVTKFDNGTLTTASASIDSHLTVSAAFGAAHVYRGSTICHESATLCDHGIRPNVGLRVLCSPPEISKIHLWIHTLAILDAECPPSLGDQKFV